MFIIWLGNNRILDFAGTRGQRDLRMPKTVDRKAL